MWIGTNGVISSSCSFGNSNCYWQNSSSLFQNITNTVSPVGAVTSTIQNQLPFFWPAFPFMLYIYLLSIYSDSPGRGKFYMIAALVFVVSAFMAIGGLIGDAIINFVIFIAAFWLTGLFNKGTTVSG